MATVHNLKTKEGRIKKKKKKKKKCRYNPQEKLTVTHLVKKFLAFCGIRRFISVFTRTRHWFSFWDRWNWRYL